MQEDAGMPGHCYPEALSIRETASCQVPSTLDIQRTNETLFGAFGRLPTERESATSLSIDLTEYPLALRRCKSLESEVVKTDDAAENDGRQDEPCSNDPLEAPCFSKLAVREQALARNSPEWIISAPDIEHAIRCLYVKYGRAPTDIEIADELRIDVAFYWETLSHLKDLEIGMLYAAHDPASDSEWLAYAQYESEGDLLFRCLRSEMQALFRDAVHNLPTMERLVIALTYSEYLYDKSISVILQSSEATVSSIRKSAILHIRASLPNPLLEGHLRVEAILPGPTEGDASDNRQGSSEQAFRCGAHVTVHGEQNGSLAAGRNWDRLGDSASCNRSFRSWYLLDVEEKLRQIKRVEHYQLDFEL